MARLASPAVLVVTALVVAACGSQKVSLNAQQGQSARILQGAQLFNEKCAGCHTLASAGAQGSAYSVRDRERVDGPNFNVRNEQKASVLYAIRNGGFSGAIMPENIVTGDDANKIAEYLARYAGVDAVQPRTPSGGTGQSP